MKTKKSLIARGILTALSAAAVCAIFYNSSLDAMESTAQSDPLVDQINAILRSLGIGLTVDSFLIRKGAHFFEYAVLGALLAVMVALYIKKRLPAFLVAAGIGLSVAVCDELIQIFPAGRSCEIRDMLIDFSGVLFAAAIVALIRFLHGKHKAKKEKEGLQSE